MNSTQLSQQYDAQSPHKHRRYSTFRMGIEIAFAILIVILLIIFIIFAARKCGKTT